MVEFQVPPTYRVATRLASNVSVAPRLSSRFAIILGSVFFGGLIVIKLIAGAIYAEETRLLPSAETEILPTYQLTVKKMTNVEKAMKSADRLVSKGYYDFSELLYAQASTLDPNLRDASYGWAYSIIKKPHLASKDLVDLHTAMSRAEAVDPLYPPLLQLKLIVATLEKDQSTTTATQARLDSLKF
ncbi:MAG TPA: hypothetical protein VGE59_04185 [Patescibacteria group bacterium]